ncbi:unnamed protein product, partial [Brassica oleracea]
YCIFPFIYIYYIFTYYFFFICILFILFLLMSRNKFFLLTWTPYGASKAPFY